MAYFPFDDGSVSVRLSHFAILLVRREVICADSYMVSVSICRGQAGSPLAQLVALAGAIKTDSAGRLAINAFEGVNRIFAGDFDGLVSGDICHVVPLLCSLMTALVYINQARCQVKCKKISDERREAFEERAAIIEFESGCYVPRAEAERIAAEHLGMTDDEIEFMQGSGL
jgi:hypothetical protein